MKKSPLILPEFIPWETERERFNKAKNRIYKWIDSDPMRLLLKTEGFECRIYQDESRWYAEEFPRIYRFVSEKWDKRNNKERFEVKTCLYSERENALLIDILEDLGFVNAMGICGEPEYLWILGGARMANYDRVFRAKEIADKYGTVKGIFIITAYRMLGPLEKDSVGTYAPDAVTEKDALMASATKIFGLPCGFSVLKKDLDDDPFSSCSVERFNDEYNGIPITVVQAPSGVRGRRANSRDTLIYLLDNYSFECGTYVYAVSSSAFVPYQYISFFDLAIKNKLNVEFGGNAYVSRNQMKLNASDILQEVKASFDAVNTFLNI